jgi:hypothetical protein
MPEGSLKVSKPGYFFEKRRYNSHVILEGKARKLTKKLEKQKFYKFKRSFRRIFIKKNGEAAIPTFERIF